MDHASAGEPLRRAGARVLLGFSSRERRARRSGAHAYESQWWAMLGLAAAILPVVVLWWNSSGGSYSGPPAQNSCALRRGRGRGNHSFAMFAIFRRSDSKWRSVDHVLLTRRKILGPEVHLLCRLPDLPFKTAAGEWHRVNMVYRGWRLFNAA